MSGFLKWFIRKKVSWKNYPMDILTFMNDDLRSVNGFPEKVCTPIGGYVFLGCTKNQGLVVYSLKGGVE